MKARKIEEMKQRFGGYDTEILVEIWQEHDRDEWNEEVFEAIRQILLTRMDVLPVQDDPDEADQHLDLAQEYFDGEQFDQALEECDLSIQTAPHYGLAYSDRGIVLEELKRWDEAAAAYTDALKLDPELPEARQGLNRALAHAKPWIPDEMLQTMIPKEILPGDVLAVDRTANLRGWPGYRNRPGLSGLDYIDTQAEFAHMESLLIRRLFTGKLRTQNRFYWFLMGFIGLCFLAPIFLWVAGQASPTVDVRDIFFYFAPWTVTGLALVYNLVMCIIQGAIKRQSYRSIKT
ncbi:MAG: tetratricopeptide repeat protein [Anaerolineaceae bacterium]|nr:tetratricopeptide repeat protein [Anaerolineaceae bacterium]